MSEATHVYVATKDGREVAYCFDDPGEEADTAAIVASWPALGRETRRLSVEEFRDR